MKPMGDDFGNSGNDLNWLSASAEISARKLLGCELVRNINGTQIRARIVETEAYDQNDQASHTFRGKTNRNTVMYFSPGHLYVYLSYGIHYCCNIVCESEGSGAAVLVRAVDPIEGLEEIIHRRGVSDVNMTNGPGKVCSALGIGMELNGHFLVDSPLVLVKRPALKADQIGISPRIGISKAVDLQHRFYINNNPFVSKRYN